jgi:hypothetical protein
MSWCYSCNVYIFEMDADGIEKVQGNRVLFCNKKYDAHQSTLRKRGGRTHPLHCAAASCAPPPKLLPLAVVLMDRWCAIYTFVRIAVRSTIGNQVDERIFAYTTPIEMFLYSAFSTVVCIILFLLARKELSFCCGNDV